MAEELDKYFAKIGIRSRYIHSDVDTLERVEILQDLRAGLFDVLVGVNLLRECLDLPEVALVAILDADNEGFLRSERALVQTVGRAARNLEGKVIMYADKITDAMKKTIDETNRRRIKQEEYNTINGIIPKQIENKNANQLLQSRSKNNDIESNIEEELIVSDPVVSYMSRPELEKSIKSIKRKWRPRLKGKLYASSCAER